MVRQKFFCCFLCTMLISMLMPVFCLTVSAEQPVSYIKTADEFNAAVSRREPVIYVDDIAFEGSSSFVALTYDVIIVGKAGGSRLSNVYFEVIGTQTENDRLTASFEDIVFDGKFDSTGYSISEEKSYSEIFGSDRKRYRAFTVDTGYYNVSFDSCEFTGYSACNGAVFFGCNDSRSSNADKHISFTDCRFYGNLSQYGTVVVGGERIYTSLSDCEFYGNHAMSSAGCRLVNGESRMTNVSVHDNHFLPFDCKEKPDLLDAGGGMYLGGVGTYRNITVENNKSVRGGGICIIRAGSGNGEMTFAGLQVKNNTALEEGGGLYVQSMTGQALRFFNCLFEGNTSEGAGGVMYATPISPFSGKYPAGLIDFTLCTFRGNTATDNRAFEFYELKYPETQKGSITLRGCLVSDMTTLENKNGEAPDYNFIGAGVMLPDKAVVPKETVAEWASGFGELKYARAFTVGYNEALEFKAPKDAYGYSISPTIPILYSVCLLASMAMLVCYLIFVKKRYVRLTLMLIAVCVVNGGYLAFSISDNLREALLATRLTYIGSTFLPLLFFFTISYICQYKMHRRVNAGLIVLSVLMLAATQFIGYSELFFKGTVYVLAEGVVRLKKSYGVLHTLYSFCVALLFFMGVGIAAYTARKKRLSYFRCVAMVLLAGLINMTAWFIQFFVPFDFELLSVSFILTNGLLIFLYSEMTASGLWEADEPQVSPFDAAANEPLRAAAEADEKEHSVSALENNNEFETDIRRIVETYDAAKMKKLCDAHCADHLTKRESELLMFLLRGVRRKEAALQLGIAESTVKTHSNKIYSKLNVLDRTELQMKIVHWSKL